MKLHRQNTIQLLEVCLKYMEYVEDKFEAYEQKIRELEAKNIDLEMKLKNQKAVN